MSDPATNQEPVQPDVPATEPQAKEVATTTQAEPEQAQTETPDPEKPDEKPEDTSVIRQVRKANRHLNKQVNSLLRTVDELRTAINDKGIETRQPEPATEQQQQAQQQSTQQTEHPAIVDKIAEAKKNFTDFDELWKDVQDTYIPPESLAAMRDSIGSFKYGSDVLYQMVKNPEIIEEISTMSPSLVAARIGEIHAEIKISKNAPKPAVKPAPAPIDPVNSARVKSERDYENMSMAEFMKVRREEETKHKLRFYKG